MPSEPRYRHRPIVVQDPQTAAVRHHRALWRQHRRESRRALLAVILWGIPATASLAALLLAVLTLVTLLLGPGLAGVPVQGRTARIALGLLTAGPVGWVGTSWAGERLTAHDDRRWRALQNARHHRLMAEIVGRGPW